MKKGVLLPLQLKKQLHKDYCTSSNIIYCAKTDRNADCELADGYIILTNDYLLCAVAPVHQQQLFVYKAFPYKKMPARPNLDFVYQITSYELAQITDLKITSQVNGSCLYMDGEYAKQIALFSNSYLNHMYTLIQLFHKYKNKEAITEEDYKEQSEFTICPKCRNPYPSEKNLCPKCSQHKAIILRILSYFKPFVPQMMLMLFCYLGISALNLIWPYLNGTILYDKILNRNEDFLHKLGIPNGQFILGLGLIVMTMVITRLLLQILQVLQDLISASIVPRVIADMKSSIFESMGKLSISFFTSRETGTLMTRVLSDADRVTNFFVDILPYLFTNILTILSTCIIMFILNARLAVASLFLLPVLAFLSFKLLPKLFHLFGKRHRAERNMAAQINDNITGARVVKAFGQEKHEINRFNKYNAAVGSSELSIVGFDNRFQALYTFVQNVASLAVWGIGSYLVLFAQNMEMGLLITFAGYVTQLNGPLGLMSRAIRSWTDSLNSAQRMFEIIDAVPEITEKSGALPFTMKKGSITLEHVTFSYDSARPVLRDMNLHIEGGSMLGIVGRSGAGKSTLVSLISRLYDPQQGRILIDGVDIRELSFADLRRNIAMVSQETYIFMGTVAENIGYANPDASQTDIIRAAKLASAHDFICRLPNGYDTLIGSSGKSLSGGERQRLSIARAILADPKILILDEATASVDTQTEKEIQDSLNYLTRNRTTLSIAHRLSTLRDADELIVIDRGTITEHGTHQELINQRGIYYKLMELQTKALAMKGIE